MPDRQQLDSEFNDRLKKLDGYGERLNAPGERVHRTYNGKDYEAKVKQLQKESRQILAKKFEDNRRRGLDYRKNIC